MVSVPGVGPEVRGRSGCRSSRWRLSGVVRMKATLSCGLPARDPFAFRDDIDGIRVDIVEQVLCAARPADLHAIDTGRAAQPEIDSRVAMRSIAAVAVDRAEITLAAAEDSDFGMIAVPVAFRPDRLEADPVIAVFNIIVKKLRRSVLVVDQH